MELSHSISFLLHLMLGAFFSYIASYTIKQPRLQKLFLFFLLLAVSFFIFSAFSFVWAFSLINYALTDLLIINALLFSFQVIVLLIIFSYIFRNDNVLSLSFLYILSLILILFGLSFSFSILVVSFFILLLLSLIVSYKTEFNSFSRRGMIYAIVAFLLLAAFIYELFNQVYIVTLLVAIFSLFFIELFYILKKSKSITIPLHSSKKERSAIFDFLKYFVFIIILINVMFIATVVVHELGHFGSAKYFDCGYSRIVFESGLPHTEVLCGSDDPFNHMMTVIFGILLPLIVSFFFFFSGGQFIHELGTLIIGFNLMISYKDLLEIGFTPAFATFVSIIGLVTVVVAVGFLILSRARDHHHAHFTTHLYHKSLNGGSGKN